ncbi:hypothetical protein BJ742DRAFT_840073 [Cladochytrium replicatum]|nr:hypothetical protein BJ742DRAFT_840073 [Cladochytrium replicatum]
MTEQPEPVRLSNGTQPASTLVVVASAVPPDYLANLSNENIANLDAPLHPYPPPAHPVPPSDWLPTYAYLTRQPPKYRQTNICRQLLSKQLIFLILGMVPKKILAVVLLIISGSISASLARGRDPHCSHSPHAAKTIRLFSIKQSHNLVSSALVNTQHFGTKQLLWFISAHNYSCNLC